MLLKSKISKLALLASGVVFFANSAMALETAAKNVILVDYDTGEYLYAKDANKRIPPASMSKLMTVYMIFDFKSILSLLILYDFCVIYS